MYAFVYLTHNSRANPEVSHFRNVITRINGRTEHQRMSNHVAACLCVVMMCVFSK